ncbi:hypothetical protein GA0115257_11059 [Streptomyces sp. LcepLS]|nr:hypothetical protein GA0115251_11371 [Streptomyces sp. TverLS-915]SCF30208.1 hypothetical protein GA0115257_11059 [Streptomyces sp. LcepLS]
MPDVTGPADRTGRTAAPGRDHDGACAGGSAPGEGAVA